ncbi:MAG: ABC transporter ATP-binding protein [Nocardioidaceae bacterium]
MTTADQGTDPASGVSHSLDTEASHGVEIRNVSKVYAGMGRPALDDVSLDVAPGEFMTFLGPSGSGKTTMLSIIAGLTANDGGSVRIDGADISGLKPHKRNLGVVFQQYALFPHMTVAANVAYPLQQRGVRRAEIHQRVDEVLNLVRLGDLANRYPRQLSGGQQQRVAIARAVVYGPRALLMDEPLGALDKKLRGELQQEIARMHRELGMTFIFVTHDQYEALSLSDRIAVFNNGLVEQIGTPNELYEKPDTLFVAQFLGDSNCFSGQLDHAAGVIGCDGLSLRVAAEQARDAAENCVVVVRPERLTLHADESSIDPSHNRVQAVMTDVTYGGDHRQVGLDFGGSRVGIAKYSADQPIPAMPGEPVWTSWDPAYQSVVPDDPSPDGHK